MIGGHIFDVGAVRQLATGGPYVIARVMVAVRDVQALYVPTTALAAGMTDTRLTPHDRQLVEEALGAPAFTFVDLDREAALAVADLASGAGIDIALAHVAHVALSRPGLPVLTSRPAELRKVHPSIEVDELP